MTLRVSMVIDGDASGAAKAAGEAKQALAGLAQTAANANAPLTAHSAAIGKMAHESAGMSTQAMALQHSLRSMAEGAVLGIPPTQMLALQLNHLTYAASGPGGLKGAL